MSTGTHSLCFAPLKSKNNSMSCGMSAGQSNGQSPFLGRDSPVLSPQNVVLNTGQDLPLHRFTFACPQKNPCQRRKSGSAGNPVKSRLLPVHSVCPADCPLDCPMDGLADCLLDCPLYNRNRNLNRNRKRNIIYINIYLCGSATRTTVFVFEKTLREEDEHGGI